MENTTLKNMNIVLNEAKNNLSEMKILEVKTLMNTYLTLLKKFRDADIVFNRIDDETSRQLRKQASSLELLKECVETDITHTLTDGKFKDADNLSVTLERIVKAIRDVSYLFPKGVIVSNREFPVNQTIQDLLNLSVKSGTLVTFFDESHRGHGKTTALIKKAHELDVVLVTAIGTQAKYVTEMAIEMGLRITVTSVADARLPQHDGKMRAKGYLVDELVSKEEFIKLKDYKLLGGFSRIVI